MFYFENVSLSAIIFLICEFGMSVKNISADGCEKTGAAVLGPAAKWS